MPFIPQQKLSELEKKADLLEKFKNEWEVRRDLDPNPEEIAVLLKYPNGGDFCEQYLERGRVSD